MLSKKFRLPGNQIPEVIKKGKRFSFPLFNLVVSNQTIESSRDKAIKKSNHITIKPHNHQTLSRFAFVISKKISKKAVVRNRTKRLLSESVRLLMPQIRKGCDVIFFAKKPLLEEKLQNVMPVVEKGLKKARLII